MDMFIGENIRRLQAGTLMSATLYMILVSVKIVTE